MPTSRNNDDRCARFETSHCGCNEPIPDIIPLRLGECLFDLLDIVIDQEDMSAAASNSAAKPNTEHITISISKKRRNFRNILSNPTLEYAFFVTILANLIANTTSCYLSEVGTITC